jgi:prepilin-type N-terminal cleavage/methylation domain-containing protein
LPPVFISADCHHGTAAEEKAEAMKRQKTGFTLIEMLIVTAIVGILAALLIPVFLSSVQKAKQKGTMQDMNAIAKTVIDYITDRGFAPEQDGPMIAGSSFLDELNPFYMKALPLLDQWGTAFYVYCGTAVDSAGIGGVTADGPDGFVVVSYGRDRVQTPHTYDRMDPTTAYFELTGLPSFDEDLIIWNGSWIHAPKTAQLGRT